MAAPTFGDIEASAWAARSSANEVTDTITWAAGDLILVIGGTEDTGATLNTPTATGLTFALVTSTAGNSNTRTYLWSATAGSSGSSAVTATPAAGGTAARGIVAFVVSGSDGLGDTGTITGSTAKTISLTREGDNSAVIATFWDWNAVNDTAVTPAPASGGTVDQAVFTSGATTGYCLHWTDQGAAGTAAYGLADHTGTVDMGGIAAEILGTEGGEPTDFPLEASPATFAVTGTAATPLAGRQAPADPGAYTVTGAAATPLAGRAVNAQPGSHAVTGAQAGFLLDRIFTLDPATYALTGTAANPIAARLFTASPGTYTLTGIQATPTVELVFSADPGAFTVTGSATGLLADRLIGATPGTFTVTGEDAELLFEQPGAFELNAETGTYTVTGAAAGLIAARIFGADPGTYAITGNVAGLATGKTLNAETGTLAITGAQTGLTATRLIPATAGGYIITGVNAELVAAGQAAATAPVRITFRETGPSAFQEQGPTTHRDPRVPTFQEGK